MVHLREQGQGEAGGGDHRADDCTCGSQRAGADLPHPRDQCSHAEAERDDRHQGAEGRDHRGAGRQVPEKEAPSPRMLTRNPNPQPTTRRPDTDAQESPHRGGDDEVGEDQEDAGHADRAGHDHPERDVEAEVPPADPPSLLERASGSKRDLEERPADDEWSAPIAR